MPPFMRYNEGMKKQLMKNDMKSGRGFEKRKSAHGTESIKKSKAKKQTIIGVLSKTKRGFGFVVQDMDENGERPQDTFIAERYMNGAMGGDRVEVTLLPQNIWQGQRAEGYISNIESRAMIEAVGTFQKSKRFGFVVPDDKKMHEDIFIAKKDFSGAQSGDKVVAKITTYPDGENSAEGRISEIIARMGEPGADIKALIRSHGYFKTFPSRAQAQAKAVQNAGVIFEEGTRVDLRNKLTVTIDGADSKDFDDAISAEILENGNYLLGVHIADVSDYVKEGSALDKEALKRGTSIYLIDQVVPMLPKELSNDICSLNPHVDRLTLSVDMEITKEGKIINHKIYESIINSSERLVYDDVSDIIEGKSEELKEKYSHIYDFIMLIDEMARVLNKKRKARGSLDFDFDEAYITLDKKGIPISVNIAQRRVANGIIEEFMLAANETVAEHFFWMEVPFVYRVHEKPSIEKIEELKTFLRGFGVNLSANSDSIHPRMLSDILSQIKGQTYENVVSTVMLRAMRKAFYGVKCEGHFGLSLKYYCHFTSPIRRYPDLIIHRIIKEIIRGVPGEKRLAAIMKMAEIAADSSSLSERKALELEREVEKMKKAEYMSYHIGEIYDGVISGITNYGIYVELENTVEGMIRIDYLMDDFYDYEPEKYRIIGRNTNKIYSLGQKVTIKVHDVSIENREIDFVFKS